ncbi:MAG: NAD(P)H-hydrate dehydratase [Bacteroidales bacterium]|jgi:NAD(P)H-hydrate epimerase|nr:NAD(P)H-hydrate dehydratase [Bacteroidales bacterium]MDY0368243.1 NAD(P)H-hydrate dehydratase [Bacteroidales bacterium]
MYKILSTEQIRQADAYTIANEPIASIDLMERAAMAVFQRMLPKLSPNQKLMVFAGKGNNGGDGLVLARLFHQQGIEVEVFILNTTGKGSPDFEINLQRIQTIGCRLNYLTDESHFPLIHQNDLLIDALFGSGLNRPIGGLAESLLQHMNDSQAVIVAVDMPSGLFADRIIDPKDTVIRADYTYTFQWPKLSLLFRESEYFAGNWEVVPIGLHPEFERQVQVVHHFIEPVDIRRILLGRSKFSHKGSFGHALLLAGSSTKSGAAILAAQACLRSGAGLLHTHLSQKVVLPMQCSLPEAMISRDTHTDFITVLPDLSTYHAIAIGPGIGQEEQTAKVLKLLIQQTHLPLVLDADALNMLAANKTWLSFLPKNSILTPHPGEFERLAGSWSDSIERTEMQREFSIRYQVFVVLKGAYTCISSPDGKCWFNPTGNPGMATAGSGDVLTGIVLGLLARGYTPQQACWISVFVHGMAGDLAIERQGMESLIASDIIDELSHAFRRLYTDT